MQVCMNNRFWRDRFSSISRRIFNYKSIRNRSVFSKPVESFDAPSPTSGQKIGMNISIPKIAPFFNFLIFDFLQKRRL